MGEILLGTSGWSYNEWVGPLYKDKKESKFTAYSRVFGTAEIDSTFYSYPSMGMVRGLLRNSKPGFVFTAKLPKVITHQKLLDLDEGVQEDLRKFCDLMRPLQATERLGCLLIQLPPRFGIDSIGPLERFFEILPSEFRFSVEFREPSWMCQESWDLLSKHGVAYTIVDEPLLPPEVRVTSSIAYFRWHGRGPRPWYNYRYKPEELQPWFTRVRDAAGQTERVFGYFNNHYHGYAVENCLQVLEMLGDLTEEQARAKSNVQKHLQSALDKGPVSGGKLLHVSGFGVADLLSFFIDRSRLKRAEEIGDEELRIHEVREKTITASVRGYHIVIDAERRQVLHDCADWDRCIQEGELCKHIGKLLLSIEESKAKDLLSRMRSEKGLWVFGPYSE